VSFVNLTNEIVAIHSKQLSRLHSKRLLKHGLIRDVFRGWFIYSMPDEKQYKNSYFSFGNILKNTDSKKALNAPFFQVVIVTY
jgi:hypothetical protein